MPTDTAGDLLDQLRRGDVGAVGDLFAEYEPFLRAVVRTHLSDRLRAKFDSLDVVQSVWVQVVGRLRRDAWPVADEGHLRALLVTIARRRLVTRARECARRPDGEQPGADWAGVADARHQPPDAAAAADDLWGRMLALTPPEHHPVLRLRRDGLPLAEIAARTGLHEGSVRRILRRLSRELALAEEPLPE